MASTNNRDEVFKCLNTLFKRLNLTEEDYQTSLDIGKGVNYTGEIKKFYVKGRNENDENVELRLIMKLAPNYLPIRTILTIDRAYQCETFVYRTLFPIFAEMQVEIDFAERFQSYPNFFTSSDCYLNEILVLEDMVQYKVIDRLNTLSYDQALVLTKAIGKLHAMSFVLRKRDPKCFREISAKIRNEKRNDDEYSKLVYNGLSRLSCKILNVLDPINDKTAYQKFADFSKIVDMAFNRHYSFDYNDDYGVVSHCDLWACNLLFNDQNFLNQVCIIDWQTARVCSPCIDLSQILFACCDKSVRDKNGIDLIQAYYDSCSSHIQQLGEDPNSLFPYTVFKKHLKEYAGYSLCIAIRTIYMTSISADDIPDLSNVKTYMDVVNMYDSPKLNPEMFDKRIRDLILDYISYGYDL